MIVRLFALGLFLTVATLSPARAETVIYTDQTAFLNALTGGSYTNNFGSLAVNNLLGTSLNFSGNGFTYTATSSNSSFLAMDVSGLRVLSSNSVGSTFTFDFTSGNVFAVGGFFYLGNSSGTPMSGEVQFSLSDGTTYTLVNPDLWSFVGFLSDGAPLASLSFTNISYSSIPTFWTSVRDLTVGYPQIQYWDSREAGAPGGSWGTASANWSNLSAGGGTASGWVNGGSAVFSADTQGEPGDFTVTLATNVMVDSISLVSGTDGSTLTIAPGAGTTITTASADMFVSVADDLELKMDAIIAGTGGLTKIGAGTLTLTADNTYEGDTFVKAGTLRLDGAGRATWGPYIVPGNIVVGNSTSPGAAESAVLQLSAYYLTDYRKTLTVYSDGLVDFNFLNTGGLFMTGGRVVGRESLLLSGNIMIYAHSESAVIATWTSNWGLNMNSGTRTVTVEDGTAVYDLDAQIGIRDGVLVKEGQGTMRIAKDGLSTASMIHNGGTLALGADKALGDGTLFTVAGGTITADGGDRTIANNILLNAGMTVGGSLDGTTRNMTLSGNISGAGVLWKEGDGDLTLSGANSYSGGTVVKGGKLIVASNTALGNSADSFAATVFGTDATLQVNSGISVSETVLIYMDGTVDNRGTISGALFGGVQTYGNGTVINTGTITGTAGDGIYFENGEGTVTNEGEIEGEAGNGIWLKQGGSVTNRSGGRITGTMGFDGLWVEGGAGIIENLSGSTITGAFNGITLVEGGSVTNSGNSTIEAVGAGAAYGVQGSDAAVTIDNLDTSTITGRQRGIWLEGGGTVNNEGTITGTTYSGVSFTDAAATLNNKGTINGGVRTDNLAHTVSLFTGSTINGALNMGTNAGAKLNLDGAGTQTYSLAVTGATTFSGVLTKLGLGTWTLDQALNVASTEISAGKLVVNSTLSGATTVKSGATLGGSGSLGAVTVEGGGILEAGNSPGTLTFASLVLNETSVMNFELGAPLPATPGVGSDYFDITGALTLDGVINVSALVGFGEGDYELMSYGSLTEDNGVRLGRVAAPFEYSLVTDTTTKRVLLEVTAADWQYWDGADTSGNGTVNGGTGTWDNATTNWTTSTGVGNAEWAGTVGAVFSGTAGTVTIAAGTTVDVPAMSFMVDGYTVAAAAGGALNLIDDGLIEVWGGATATISAPITGGALEKSGGGTLNLSGNNTYTGGTKITEGVLAARHNSALGTGGVEIGADGTLSVETSELGIGALTGAGEVILEGGNGLGITVASGTAEFSGDIVGADFGILVKAGAGTQVLSGDNTFGGVAFVAEGALVLASNTALSSAAYLGTATGAQATIDGVDLTIGQLNNSSTNGGTVFLDGGSLTLAGAAASNNYYGVVTGTGRLIMDGAGSTQTLHGANDYSGGTLVKNGTLRAGAAGGLAGNTAYEITGGKLDLNDYALTVSELKGTAGEVDLGSAVLTVNQTTNTAYAGVISGTGSVTKTGTGRLTLSGANTYVGGTTVSGGTLTAADANVLGTGAVTLGGAGALEVAAGKTLAVSALNWQSGGTFKFTLGSIANTTEFIDIEGVLTQGGTGFFEFTDGGFLGNTTYDLLTFDDGSVLDPTLLDATDISGLTKAFDLRDNLDGTQTLTITYTGSSTGPVINNLAPEWTPMNADFLVEGEVTSVAGTQQVNSLIILDQGRVTILGELLVNGGLITVDEGTGSITGGPLFVPGSFQKLGDGLLDLVSNVIAAGATYVKGGTLSVNGSLTTTDLYVELGNWLKGAGLINGNVWNSGTVAPGNSPGTMTVNGNFTQAANGTLQIEVADNAFDQLIVTGRASLAGTLQGIAFGGHQFEYGDQVPFLRAGSISGEFDRIVMPNKFRGRFLVNGNVGSLLVAPESYTLVAENQNQKNVAKALDSFIGKSGDRDAVSLALDLQTEDQYGNAFDQIAPGFYQSLTDMVIEQTSAQNQMLAQRLSAVRLGARGFNVIGLDQAAIKHDVGGKNVLDAKGAKDVISPATETNWSVFVQGNGIFARTMNVSQIPSYRFNSGGFLVGADYKFGTDAGSKLIAGIYTGYQGTYSRYANGGQTTINSALFGGYASFSNGGFYSDLIVGGSYNGYRASRSIDFSTIDRTARSSPDGGSLTTYLDAGYDWKVGGFTFGPLVSAQYTYAGTSGFTESGADSLDLKVGQQNANSIRTNIGGRIAFTWQVTDTITIVPEWRMFWQHEYLNGPRDINASLNGGSGPGFEYTTIAPGRDSVFAGAGVSANFGDRWSTYFYYNANFGREDFVSHMISGGLNFKF